MANIHNLTEKAWVNRANAMAVATIPIPMGTTRPTKSDNLPNEGWAIKLATDMAPNNQPTVVEVAPKRSWKYPGSKGSIKPNPMEANNMTPQPTSKTRLFNSSDKLPSSGFCSLETCLLSGS